MLTPHLEKLILEGKASFNTFVAGGSEKCVLNVDNDRYIIITNLIYQSPANTVQALSNTVIEMGQYVKDRMLTQMKLFSEKSVNNFVFRDQVSVAQQGVNSFVALPSGSQSINTYLVHESDVSFTFSRGCSITTSVGGITPATSVGYPIPFDYGKDGQNAEPVRLIGAFSLVPAEGVAHGGNAVLVEGSNYQPTELVYPIDSLLNYPDIITTKNFPLCIVQYVEIFGNLTNISATL